MVSNFLKMEESFMKEIIGAVVLLIGLYGGTKVIKEIHSSVRKAALEKAALGLPSLPRFKQSKNR